MKVINLAKIPGWRGKRFYTTFFTTKIPLVEYEIVKEGNYFAVKFYRLSGRKSLMKKWIARNKTQAKYIISLEKRRIAEQAMLERSLP